MSDNNIVSTNIDIGVDIPQFLIITSAIFGMGLLWINFSEKVFKTACRLAAAPFSRPIDKKKEE